MPSLRLIAPLVILFTMIHRSSSIADPRIPNGSISFPGRNSKLIANQKIAKAESIIFSDDKFDAVHFKKQSLSDLLSRNPKLASILPRQCGQDTNPVISPRIIGGFEAAKGGWPWMAHLGYYDRGVVTYSCGGVLISQRHVLTAAHCVRNNMKLVTVRLGAHDKNGRAPQDYNIRHLDVHDSYDINYQKPVNDIAIITLARPVQFTDAIQPICLPTTEDVRSMNLAGRMSYVIGWGETSFLEHSLVSDELKQVSLPIVRQAKCAYAYRNIHGVKIDDSVICAGFENGGRDACRGDSGGPLMVYEAGQYYVMGLVSFGVRCGSPGFPGIYSRVTRHMDWILSKIVR